MAIIENLKCPQGSQSNPPQQKMERFADAAPRIMCRRAAGREFRQTLVEVCNRSQGDCPNFRGTKGVWPNEPPFPPRKWDCPLRIQRRKLPAPPRQRLLRFYRSSLRDDAIKPYTLGRPHAHFACAAHPRNYLLNSPCLVAADSVFLRHLVEGSAQAP